MREVVSKIAKAIAVACFAGAATTTHDAAQDQAAAFATRPAVSEDVAPLEPIAPTTRDGNRGEGFLRRDISAFLREHLRTQAVAVDPRPVKEVPF